VNLSMMLVSLAIGLGAEGVFRVATRAAQQTRDQATYAAAVFAVTAKGSGERP